jgi:hypothetical protein
MEINIQPENHLFFWYGTMFLGNDL